MTDQPWHRCLEAGKAARRLTEEARGKCSTLWFIGRDIIHTVFFSWLKHIFQIFYTEYLFRLSFFCLYLYIKREIVDLAWNGHNGNGMALAPSSWQFALFSSREKMPDFATYISAKWQKIVMFLVCFLYSKLSTSEIARSSLFTDSYLLWINLVRATHHTK